MYNQAMKDKVNAESRGGALGQKPEVTVDDFEKLDIRLGKIVDVQDFPEARNPAFKIWVDFGKEVGIKKSSLQVVGAHTKDELLGMLVCCVVNFPPRQVGPFMSEVLTLGFKNAAGDAYILITPSKDTVEIGDYLR